VTKVCGGFSAVVDWMISVRIFVRGLDMPMLLLIAFSTTKNTKSSVVQCLLFFPPWNLLFYFIDDSVSFLLAALGLNFIRAYPLLSNV